MLTGSGAKKGRPAAGEAAKDAPAPERTRRAFIHRTKPKAEAAPRRAAEDGNGKLRSRLTADDLARQQREISVSEFFTKNRHLLGFDNPTKALLTTVKEAVDNSLDACEEAGILPDVLVEIKALEEEDRFRVTVRDNGPGIVPKQVPQIFGQLLYGSKFHRLKMSRGQQGIGISAAGMYGLLTTGRPMKVISRPGEGHRAKYYELQIDTKRNQPVVHKEEFVEWRPGSGTEVSIELVAKYIRGRRSVEEYLESTAIANPHVRIEYSGPDGEKAVYPRASKELPPEPREIKPHPHGVELGLLIKMLQETSSHTLAGFLRAEFCRVSDKVARELCAAAKLYERSRPKRIARDEIDKLYKAIAAAKLMNPPTDCLAPIGEDGLVAGLQKQIKADFYTAVTRRPAVYRGNPFLVECGLAYGGELPEEELARVIRFANRVPLLYQQGSCAITEAVMDTDWRNYRLSQSRGALPTGPLVMTVHFASVWVPFTSESKEAVAHYPEVIHEIKLALQECGRRLSLFIGRRRRAAEAERKITHINRYVPHIAIGLREMLGLSQRQEQSVVSKLKIMLEKTRGVMIPDA
jgi:DNA topoisomerase-6 subunit B